MSNLEAKVEDGDLENVISSSLAHLTRVEVLYGGDVEASAAIMRTLSNRIQYLLQTQGDKFYNKGQYIHTPCYKKSIPGSKQPVSGKYFVAHNSARLSENF